MQCGFIKWYFLKPSDKTHISIQTNKFSNLTFYLFRYSALKRFIKCQIKYAHTIEYWKGTWNKSCHSEK